MTPRFDPEQIILVTGASSGIGKTLALRLCAEGATVVANGRNVARLEEVKALASNPERLILAPRDLLEDMDNLPRWVAELSGQFGKLSGLACCAGVDILAPLAMITSTLAEETFRINWLAPVLLARGFADRRVNAGKGSAILFIASIAARAPLKAQIIYASTKAALIAALKDIALETASRGIRANAISPGFLSTAMTQTSAFTYLKVGDGEKVSLGPGSPEDIASLACFLLSREARWITGQNYVIDGGRF